MQVRQRLDEVKYVKHWELSSLCCLSCPCLVSNAGDFSVGLQKEAAMALGGLFHLHGFSFLSQSVPQESSAMALTEEKCRDWVSWLLLMRQTERSE